MAPTSSPSASRTLRLPRMDGGGFSFFASCGVAGETTWIPELGAPSAWSLRRAVCELASWLLRTRNCWVWISLANGSVVVVVVTPN